MGKLMLLEKEPFINTNSPEYIKLLESIVKAIKQSSIDFSNSDDDDDFEPTPA